VAEWKGPVSIRDIRMVNHCEAIVEPRPFDFHRCLTLLRAAVPDLLSVSRMAPCLSLSIHHSCPSTSVSGNPATSHASRPPRYQ
jgi:hypothetical protein